MFLLAGALHLESFEKYPHFVIPAPYQVRGKLRRNPEGLEKTGFLRLFRTLIRDSQE